MILHYRVNFKSSEFSHHGQIDLPGATPEMVQGNENKIVAALKNQLVKDCSRWGMQPDEIINFITYYHLPDCSEHVFFRWPSVVDKLPSHSYRHGNLVPHRYQLNTVEFLGKRDNAVLAVGMGLGKTISCLLHILNTNPDTVLIIAPKRVAENVWCYEAAKWGLPFADKMVVVSGTPSQRAKLMGDTSRPYKIIGRDNFSDYQNHSCDILIVDELTTAKNVEAKRTKAILSVNARQKIGLTGTLTANSLVDIFGQMQAVGLLRNDGMNFYAWRGRYFTDVMRGSGQRFEKWEPREGVTVETLLSPVRDHIFTLDAADWLSMPDASYNIHPVKIAPAEYNEYLRLSTMLHINIDGDILSIKEQAKLAKLQTVCNGFLYDADGTPRRAAHSSKLTQVADFIASAVAEGEKVIVFYAFREEAIWLSEMLDKRGVTYTTPKVKDFIERFETKVDCLIGHPASIGHGIDRVQAFCRVVVWSTLTWSLELYMQANARVVRQGQKRNVSINVFVAEDTVEQRAGKALAEKVKTHNQFIDLTKNTPE